MPPRPDAERRRRQIIEAVWRITTRGGLGAASFREVASEAGVSVSLVQHYFGTKDQLLLQSLFLLAEDVGARTQAEVAALGDAPAPRDVVRAVLSVFLPTNPASSDAMLLFLAFQIAALTDPALARAEAAQVPASLLSYLAEHIAQGKGATRVRQHVEPDIEAKVLVGVVVGLATSVLAGNETVEGAFAVLDYSLDRIF